MREVVTLEQDERQRILQPSSRYIPVITMSSHNIPSVLTYALSRLRFLISLDSIIALLLSARRQHSSKTIVNSGAHDIICQTQLTSISFLAQLVERVTSNDEVSRSSRLEGNNVYGFHFQAGPIWNDIRIASSKAFHFTRSRRQALLLIILCKSRLETGKIISRSPASGSSQLACFYRHDSLNYHCQQTAIK
jgi:hypothetical protein